MTRFLAVIGLAVTAAVAGCAAVSRTPASADSVLAAAGSDTAAIARQLRERCALAQPATRIACHDEVLSAIARRGDVRLAMRALERVADENPDVRREGHVFAHGIGITAGQADIPVRTAFGSCTEAFQSGCYHGVIQANFAKLPDVGETEVRAMCQPFSAAAERWLRFQCVHGLGHGLMMLRSHDLPAALAGCDFLGEWWDRTSCYGGAFMENIVNVTAPHHPAHHLAKNPAAAGHDHAAHDRSSEPDRDRTVAFRAVDPGDPHYPCSRMADRYLAACYQMQTSVMLYLNKGDVEKTAKQCEGAPRGMKTTCFQSLGRDISGYTLQRHDESIRLCSLAAPAYRPWCYIGLVKNFVDVTSSAADGTRFCARVPDGASRALCFLAVGEQISVLHDTPTRRKDACAAVESSLAEFCHYGAGVITSPPAALRDLLAMAST